MEQHDNIQDYNIINIKEKRAYIIHQKEVFFKLFIDIPRQDPLIKPGNLNNFY